MLNVVILFFLRCILGINKVGEEVKVGSVVRIGLSEEYVFDIDYIKLRKKFVFFFLCVLYLFCVFFRFVI